jgi:hypothetical protein
VDLPNPTAIAQSSHRIHNPIDSRKLAELGEALRLTPGATMLDLASGSGEMHCTWARDHGIGGTGVDINATSIDRSKARSEEFGVADRVAFVHGDASGYVATEPVDVAACLGATAMSGGTAGTVELLQRSLRQGGLMLIGECYWRVETLDPESAARCHIGGDYELFSLPGLFEHFDSLGYDVVEMVLADQNSWDRYTAPQWLSIRRWLDDNPGDDLAAELRTTLDTKRADYVRYRREYVGWGVFALMKR